MSNKIFTVKDIATIGMMAALLEAVKVLLQSIPNIELVSLLIIIFTLYLGPKTLIAIWAFVLLECVHWGFGLWTITYFYIWPILVVCTLLLKNYKSKWPFVILSCLYGLTFGIFCSVPYLFMGGIASAFAMWVSGIPYDIVHGVGNFFIALFLFDPLYKIMIRFKNNNGT